MKSRTPNRLILESQLEQPRARVQVDVLTVLALDAVDVDAPQTESEPTVEPRVVFLLGLLTLLSLLSACGHRK